MANHNLPTQSSTYTNFVTELDARFDDLCVGLDPARTTMTNLPTNSVGWSSAGNKWQRWTGSAWADLATTYSISIGGNAATATRLQTARTINGVSFNGSANINVPTQNSITFSNTGGAAVGTTFNGSAARTISYATIGAPSVTGSGASGSWGISVTGTSANVTGTVAVANGGTGATTADAARTNLGLVIGTNIPSPTGAGATGTWNISVTGNAATATNSTQLGGVAASGYQTALGFTPVQQGGGSGMGLNKVYIGWGASGEGLRLAVDYTDFGTVWPITPDNTRLMAQIATNYTGGIGTYAFLTDLVNRATYPGGLRTGSELAYATANGFVIPNYASGTWRCMGQSAGNAASLEPRTTLWMRIS